MKRFVVQIAETRNYELSVIAENESAAREMALKEWIEAPEVGSYEIADQSIEVVAVTDKGAAGGSIPPAASSLHNATTPRRHETTPETGNRKP